MTGSALLKFFTPSTGPRSLVPSIVKAPDPTHVEFDDGVTAVCATSGLWNCNLGYNEPRVAAAIDDANRHLSYATLFRKTHPLAEAAAHKLVTQSVNYSTVAFATSGGAANDLLMKIARLYAYGDASHRGTKNIIVAVNGSYHGTTYGSQALTGENLMQRELSVDLRYVRHVDADDADGFARLIEREGHRIAAVILEPVLGTGAKTLSAELISEVFTHRAKYGYLVAADEVATGFYRVSSSFLASMDWEFVPDLAVVSKALTNGTCAASAVLMSSEVAQCLAKLGIALVHGETQAGSPGSCAAMIAVLDIYNSTAVVDNAIEVSARLNSIIDGLSNSKFVTGTSGRGCFRAVQTHPDVDVMSLVEAIRLSGAVVHPGPNSVQLVPPLVSSTRDLDELEGALRRGFERVEP